MDPDAIFPTSPYLSLDSDPCTEWRELMEQLSDAELRRVVKLHRRWAIESGDDLSPKYVWAVLRWKRRQRRLVRAQLRRLLWKPRAGRRPKPLHRLN